MYITGFSTVQADENKNQKQNTLGQDEFLKLLTAQLQYQNPLSPQESNDYMNQMTQFGVLEQLQNLNTKLQTFFETEQQFQTISMLGKEVTVGNNGDTTITGVVESVKFTEKGPKVIVKGQEFFLNQVQEISQEIEKISIEDGETSE